MPSDTRELETTAASFEDLSFKFLKSLEQMDHGVPRYKNLEILHDARISALATIAWELQQPLAGMHSISGKMTDGFVHLGEALKWHAVQGAYLYLRGLIERSVIKEMEKDYMEISSEARIKGLEAMDDKYSTNFLFVEIFRKVSGINRIWELANRQCNVNVALTDSDNPLSPQEFADDHALNSKIQSALGLSPETHHYDVKYVRSIDFEDKIRFKQLLYAEIVPALRTIKSADRAPKLYRYLMNVGMLISRLLGMPKSSLTDFSMIVEGETVLPTNGPFKRLYESAREFSSDEASRMNCWTMFSMTMNYWYSKGENFDLAEIHTLKTAKFVLDQLPKHTSKDFAEKIKTTAANTNNQIVYLIKKLVSDYETGDNLVATLNDNDVNSNLPGLFEVKEGFQVMLELLKSSSIQVAFLDKCPKIEEIERIEKAIASKIQYLQGEKSKVIDNQALLDKIRYWEETANIYLCILEALKGIAQPIEPSLPGEPAQSIEQPSPLVNSIQPIEQPLPVESVQTIEQLPLPGESAQLIEPSLPGEPAQSIEQFPSPVRLAQQMPGDPSSSEGGGLTPLSSIPSLSTDGANRAAVTSRLAHQGSSVGTPPGRLSKYEGRKTGMAVIFILLLILAAMMAFYYRPSRSSTLCN